MTRNPYKIVQLKDGRYAVEYKDYPHVGIPDSWGTKAHATAYMAALLGLTVDEMRRAGLRRGIKLQHASSAKSKLTTKIFSLEQ